MEAHNVALAEPTDTPPGEAPPTVRYRMNAAVANAACAARGATTERSRAAVMGVTVKTMRRWRQGGTPPRIDVVDSVCQRLGVAREHLFPGL